MTSNQPPAKKRKCDTINNILEILTCPVCQLNPRDPDQVLFCANGHMICDGCHGRIQKCPVCRSENLNGQNPLMKQVLLALPRMCPFSDEGCKIESEGTEMAEHIKICNFRLIKCVVGNCVKSKISHDSYIEHQIQKHKAYKYKEEGSHFDYLITIRKPILETFGKRNTKPTFWAPCIRKFDGKTFILRIFLKNNIFHAQIFLCGSVSEAEEYSCEFKLSGMKQKLNFCGDVLSLDTLNTENVEHPDTLIFYDSTARKFLDLENQKLGRHENESSTMLFDLTITKK